MLVSFQYPIIDFRSLYEENYKLSIPQWPIPEEELMIKFFGITKKRSNGGSSYWSGEHMFCSSNKAIKLPNLENHKIKFSNGYFLKSEGAFRRVNGDGNFLAKLEIGFTNPLEDFLNKIKFDNDSFEKILSDYCNIEVQIRNPTGKVITSKISSCGKAVSDLYLYSTSTSEGIKRKKINKYWATHGEPLCIVEYNDPENRIKLPKGAKFMVSYNSPDIELYHYWTYLPNKKRIRTWIIKKLYLFNSFDNYVRDIRLNLLRINAEKETVRKLLNLLLDKGDEIVDSTEKINRVGNYLEKISSKLLKETRYGIKQENILDFALSVEEKAQPGELESYNEVLTLLKNKYVKSNIEQIINKGAIEKGVQKQRSIWISGSFYIILFIIIIVFIIVAAKLLPLYILPIIIIGTLLIFSVIGAFQLKYEDKISDTNFLKLMALSFKYIPFLAKKTTTHRVGKGKLHP